MSEISDVNWLLGTVTQSSAALIAIVGGLLVSRYVALHAEQDGAARRVQDLRRRRDEAFTRRSRDLEELNLYKVNEVLNSSDVYELLTDREFQVDIPDLFNAIGVDEDTLDPKILTSAFSQLNQDLKSASEALRSLVPISEEQKDWLEFKRSNNLSTGNPSAWEWMYDTITDLRVSEAKQLAKKRAQAAREKLGVFSGFPNHDLQMPRIPAYNPTADGINRLMNSQYDLAREETLRRQIEQSTSEVRAAEQEQRLAEETLQATRQPEGFSLALQVLSVLAILGMALPVSIMGIGILSIPYWARFTVIALFFVGVSFLLRFLFVYASYLRADGRDTLPRTVFGLLRRG